MPPYDRIDYPTVAEYRKCLAKYSPGEAPTFVSLEGFVDAMVLVEGLKRAGNDLTRERFIAGIESIHEMNAGLGPKLILNYSSSDHKGFDNDYRQERPAHADDGLGGRRQINSFSFLHGRGRCHAFSHSTNPRSYEKLPCISSRFQQASPSSRRAYMHLRMAPPHRIN